MGLSGVRMTSESSFEFVSDKAKESSRWGCSEVCCRIACLKKFAKFIGKQLRRSSSLTNLWTETYNFFIKIFFYKYLSIPPGNIIKLEVFWFLQGEVETSDQWQEMG